MANDPANPFDFAGASSLEDIFNDDLHDVYLQLQDQSLRADKIENFFYDALEAPEVDPALETQAIASLEHGTAQRVNGFMADFYQYGANAHEVLRYFRQNQQPEMEQVMLGAALSAAQHAIRIVRIKGEAAKPIVFNLAHEAKGLSDDQRNSAAEVLDALCRAYSLTSRAIPYFNFAGVKTVDDILNRAVTGYQDMNHEGFSPEKIVDLFYTSLETVDASLRLQVVAHYEELCKKSLKSYIEVFTQMNAAAINLADADTLPGVLFKTRNMARHAIHVSRIKRNDIADPLTREVAKAMSMLSPEEYKSTASVKAAYLKAYETSINPPKVVSAFFNLFGAQNLDEVLKKSEKFLHEMYRKNVSQERAVDHLYEALEAIDGNLKQQAVDHFASKSEETLKSLVADFARITLDDISSLSLVYRARIAARHAVHLYRLKGAAVDPLTQEIANKVLAFSEIDYNLPRMGLTFKSAYERATKPKTPPTRPSL